MSTATKTCVWVSSCFCSGGGESRATKRMRRGKSEPKFNSRRSPSSLLPVEHRRASRQIESRDPTVPGNTSWENVRLLSRTNCRLLAWLILLQSKAIRAERHGKNGRINKGIKEMDTKRAGKQRETKKTPKIHQERWGAAERKSHGTQSEVEVRPFRVLFFFFFSGADRKRKKTAR